MQDLISDVIASFLVQAKECCLPGIGKLAISTTSAQPDIMGKMINPPVTKIIFSEKPDKVSEELVKYVSHKKGLTEVKALETIKKWCSESADKLNAGEKITLEPVGSLQKDPSGIVFLQAENPLRFFEPVSAELILREGTEHAVLAGDREITSSKMNQYLQEEEILKNRRWKIMAIILIAIAIIILCIHFYSNPFSLSSTGNQTPHLPETPSATYSAP